MEDHEDEKFTNRRPMAIMDNHTEDIAAMPQDLQATASITLATE